MTSTPDPDRRFDRHLALATELSGDSRTTIIRKFVGQRVLLTGDAGRLSTRTGRLMLLVSANLIVRFCPKIDLLLDPSVRELADEVLRLLNNIDSGAHAEFRLIDAFNDSTYAAVLAIGAPATGATTQTILDADGWLTAISDTDTLPRLQHRTDDNPFGAMMAAALGAAEMFKRLLQPLPGKGLPFGTATFSTYDYSVDTFDPGPALPEIVALPTTLLAGVGAVGNAFLLALSHIRGVRGALYPVDQEYLDDPSNLNRYALGEERDANPDQPTPKTELASRLFKDKPLDVHPLQMPLESVLERIFAGEIPRPDIVISAVDNNEARGRLQKLWPTLLLEGATDHMLSQVSRHEYGRELACLLCIHSTAADGDEFSYVTHAAEISGLPKARIAVSQRDAAVVLTDEDVQRAPESKRALLRTHLGKPICSVLAELERLSIRPPEELPHQPAVSFVSMISGLLMAGELVKYVTAVGSPLETFFQLDSMFPLQNAFLHPVEKVPTCYCVVRSESIRQYRAALTSG